MSNQNKNTKTSPKPGGAMFGGNAAVPGEKAKTLKNSFGKLLRYMGKFKNTINFSGYFCRVLHSIYHCRT